MIKNIRHTGIVIKDIDKALHFYRDILGMKVIKQERLSGHQISALLGEKDVDLTYIKLAVGEPTSRSYVSCLLELYYFHNLILPPIVPTFNHIALTVSNLNEVIFRFSRERIPLTCIPQLDKQGKHLMAFCRDYDDNLIEIVEEL